jgi:drug/metabolite transporter (DMT)-like permease
MTLTWGVVGLVLFGALLHASWNALVKSSTDKAMDTALIHLIGSLLAVPAVMVMGWPPAAAWPYIIASTVIHIGYYIALTGAYKHGDLGLTYPLMRGTAPLLVALSATFTVGESLSPMAWAGVLGVCCGVLDAGPEPPCHGVTARRALCADQCRHHCDLHRGGRTSARACRAMRCSTW